MFGFQKLDVYRAATLFLTSSAELAGKVPRGQAELAEQFRRAALSVPLNIAEGSGKFTREAARFYTIARGSALECAAILDAFEALRLTDPDDLREPRELLERVVAMLTRLIRS
jgi:four helix bundle protein